MAALIEIIIEGVKKVSSEIVAAILLLIAFAIFSESEKNYSGKRTKHRSKTIQKRAFGNS